MKVSDQLQVPTVLPPVFTEEKARGGVVSAGGLVDVGNRRTQL